MTAADTAETAEMRTGAIALVEVLDRDGHVRHALPVRAWPVRIGRALDNDLVLDDPHVAAHHLRIDADPAGAYVQAEQTHNGLLADGRRLTAGERMPVGPVPLHLDAGDTHLRLRLAEHALEPERPLHMPRSLWQATWPTAVAAVLVLAAVMFDTWLDTDPGEWTRTVAGMLIGALTAALTWCSGWSLVSKIFTRRHHFGWHARVLLLGVLAILATDTATRLVAFSLSWPAVSGFSFVLQLAIAAGMLYFHALGLEPRRPARLRTVAAVMFVSSMALTLWFNHQNRDRYADELYMTHLFPPAFRLARPVDTETFVHALQPLQARLDEKARERDAGADSLDSADEDIE